MFSNNALCFTGLSEFRVKQNRDEHLALFLQIAPGQVRTILHNNLQISSALLPLKPRTSVPHWAQGCCFQDLPSPSRSGAQASKMPESFPTVFKVIFSLFCVHLVTLSSLLCFKVLTTLVLTVSACFLIFLLGNRNVELPTWSLYWHHSWQFLKKQVESFYRLMLEKLFYHTLHE